MAALAETRDVGSSLQLPKSVSRLCCVGDSLTYGQGVAPRQSLPTHVTRFANMAYPEQLVWVDNRGQSSGNIWHSWSPLTELSKDVRYEAVFFSICENDAQIFESNSVHHGNDHAETWLRNGELLPWVRDTLVDLARVADSKGFCLITYFYAFTDQFKAVVDAIAKQCCAIHLPFVDLTQFLLHESGLTVGQYIASPFDGHPSDVAHHASGRRLVEELRPRWQPTPSSDGTVAERLLAACDQAIEAGWSTDDICHWASLVLEAKESVARRQRSRYAALLGDLPATREKIDRRYQRWYQRRTASVQAFQLHERRDDLWRILEGAYAALRNLDEMTHVLEKHNDPPGSAELWKLIEGAGYYTVSDRLQDLPVDLRARLLGNSGEDLACTPAGRAPMFRDFDLLRRQLRQNEKRLAVLLPDRLDPGSFEPNLRRLWQVASNLINSSQYYLDEFARKTADVTSDAPAQPAFFTSVDVRIERDVKRPQRSGAFSMTVEVDYIEPRRSRRRSKLWAGPNEKSHVYRLELPLLVLGDVSVGVPDWDSFRESFLTGELRIARIEVSNASSDSRVTRPRFIWEPPLVSEPLSWVTLPRLRVPD